MAAPSTVSPSLQHVLLGVHLQGKTKLPWTQSWGRCSQQVPSQGHLLCHSWVSEPASDAASLFPTCVTAQTHVFPLHSSQQGWVIQWVLNPPVSQLPKLEHPSVCTISDTICFTAAAIGTPAIAVWMSLDKIWMCTNKMDVIFTPGMVDN